MILHFHQSPTIVSWLATSCSKSMESPPKQLDDKDKIHSCYMAGTIWQSCFIYQAMWN